jgi:hypothetical protein
MKVCLDFQVGRTHAPTIIALSNSSPSVHSLCMSQSFRLSVCAWNSRLLTLSQLIFIPSNLSFPKQMTRCCKYKAAHIPKTSWSFCWLWAKNCSPNKINLPALRRALVSLIFFRFFREKKILQFYSGTFATGFHIKKNRNTALTKPVQSGANQLKHVTVTPLTRPQH